MCGKMTSHRVGLVNVYVMNLLHSSVLVLCVSGCLIRLTGIAFESVVLCTALFLTVNFISLYSWLIK